MVLLTGVPPLQSGIQSLPRELEPARRRRACASGRCGNWSRSVTIRKTRTTSRSRATGIYKLKEIAGDAIELKATFGPTTAKQYGLHVYCDANGSGGFPIMVDPEAKILSAGHAESPLHAEFRRGSHLAGLSRQEHDRGLCQRPPGGRRPLQGRSRNLGVSIGGKGGDVVVKEIMGWKMKSIYKSAP